jgi:hypothetical protein
MDRPATPSAALPGPDLSDARDRRPLGLGWLHPIEAQDDARAVQVTGHGSAMDRESIGEFVDEGAFLVAADQFADLVVALSDLVSVVAFSGPGCRRDGGARELDDTQPGRR